MNLSKKQKTFIVNNKSVIKQLAIEAAAGVAASVASSLCTIAMNKKQVKKYDLKYLSKKDGKLEIEELNFTTIARDVIHPYSDDAYDEV